MEQITSRENPSIKRAAKLVSSKRERLESGLFVTEGARLSAEAAQSGVVVREFFCTAAAKERYPEFVEPLLRCAKTAWLITESVANRLADTQTPQGVYCVCERPTLRLNPASLAPGRYLALESLQDPGNLGTIMRTADAFALDGLLLTADCPDPLSPKALRATMGSAFRVPWATVEDLPSWLTGLCRSHQTYAAVPDATAHSVLGCTSWESAVVVVGNEGSGLTEATIEACTQRLTIDMPGHAESLNAAVAAAVIMWEMCRRPPCPQA